MRKPARDELRGGDVEVEERAVVRDEDRRCPPDPRPAGARTRARGAAWRSRPGSTTGLRCAAARGCRVERARPQARAHETDLRPLEPRERGIAHLEEVVRAGLRAAPARRDRDALPTRSLPIAPRIRLSRRTRTDARVSGASADRVRRGGKPLTVASAWTIAGLVPASFFDVDGTLVRTNLLHPTLFYLANQPTPLRSLGAPGARRARGARGWPWPRCSTAGASTSCSSPPTRASREDRLLLLADEAFDTVHQARPLSRARATSSQRCRDEGHDVVLVSGALDFLMERLAKHLGATGHHRQPARDQGRLRHRASSCAPSSRAPRRRASSASTRARTATTSTTASPTPTATPTCRCSRSSATRAPSTPTAPGKLARTYAGRSSTSASALGRRCWSASMTTASPASLPPLATPVAPAALAPRAAHAREPSARRHARQEERAAHRLLRRPPRSRSTCRPARASSTRARRSSRSRTSTPPSATRSTTPTAPTRSTPSCARG